MQIRKAPKTEAVYLRLKEKIDSGMYPAGMLPVEPELAEQLQVSRKTLRSALTRLALENYIVRIKGEGTFINRSAAEAGRILVMVRDEESITNPDRYILPGIQQEAAAMNLQADTCTCLSLTAGSAEAAVRRIMSKNYRGIISMESNFTGTEPVISILKRTGLPVLLPHAMPCDAENTPFAVMGTDYRRVMRDAIQYLAGLGHRRIAYLAFKEFRIARKDYFRLLEELGPDRDPALYFDSPSYRDHDTILTSIGKMFAGCRKPPTAVLCFSDYFALCLYEYLQAKHLNIPEDVAVLSIGGMIGCDFLSPPLSAIDFGCMEIGRLAVRTLMEMRMKNELTRPFITTPHHLTERESTRKNAIPRMPAAFLPDMEEQKNVQCC